jgi:hypothetical protein
MENWYMYVYKSLIIASIILFIISFFTNSNTTVGSLIAAYSVLILAIMMITVIIINGVINVSQNKGIIDFILTIIMNGGPFLLMLGVIGLILYLIITYGTKIGNGNVSPSYYTFSNINVILFLLQIYLIYNSIISDKFQITGKISKITLSLVYLIGIVAGICSLVQFTILKYFTTDG